MIRKLIVMFLIGTISLLGVLPALAQEQPPFWVTIAEYERATGKTIEKFNEAPELKVKVAAGELPPVEERLPAQPLVVNPVEEIGQYGGTWRRVSRGTKDLPAYGYLLNEPLGFYSEDYSKIVPNVVKGWKLSEDCKTVTFYLRKGMKWSDGAPFTADDFVFWWNDITLNKELNPTVPGNLRVAGEPGKIEKIDNYTFKLSFIKPYPTIINVLGSYYAPLIYAPEHYLKQFHPKYTPMEKIEKEMRKEGFTLWIDFFKAKNTRHNNPELPVIQAWYPLDTTDRPIQRWVRNPYYWKVDTKGNQLPYIDKIQQILLPDAESMLLKAIAGDVDFQYRGFVSTANYTVLMENRKKGDYELIPRGVSATVNQVQYFNFFHKDPVLRKIFRNKEFRIALSIAINREEINEFINKGLGEICQPSPAKVFPYYNEKLAKQYTEYDPKRANEILDELGLKWDKDHKYRLRPDGKRLKFVAIYAPYYKQLGPAQELIKKYWEKIGIQMVLKPVSMELWVTRVQACEHDVAVYTSCMAFPGMEPTECPATFPLSTYSYWAPMWALWFSSNGKSGEEPPADVKRLMELLTMIKKEPSMKKRNELYKEVFEIHQKNFWQMGCTRATPAYYLIKNNVRNVDREKGIRNIPLFDFSQIYFKK